MILKTLTKAEEQVMQYLWEMERGFLKDILEKFPEPRPAYTTVSTVIRVLVKKGFISFRTYGKVNEYYPKISKSEYFQHQVKPMISNYFQGSPATMVSYFSNAKLNLYELEEIKKLIDDRIKKLKTKKK
ncbi:BlaI/MecI/CopY family transcriptional regulator [Chryseolinea sp. H1M3-3]|uniref:BlaI/MecI/CopY family transcriptional regulator n=1 Tax=Chryseolinea sp. H1M3-3 TaxID=3034144 RepID=UPI0023EDBDBC|nr:BlaI/MecI/CopY family transcriptional regulator [Chryseolinea sp. H1M3-3]